MSIRVKISKDGTEEMSLTEFSVKSYNKNTFPLEDDDVKKNNLVNELILVGIINQEIISKAPAIQTDEYGEPVLDESGQPKEELSEIDSIRKLANYAVIPEYVDCYKDIDIEITNSMGIVVKTESFKNMYVYEFQEKSDNEMGAGRYLVKFREQIFNASN